MPTASDPWRRTIRTYHDGYLWCVWLGSDFLGRFGTEREAIERGYAAKCSLTPAGA